MNSEQVNSEQVNSEQMRVLGDFSTFNRLKMKRLRYILTIFFALGICFTGFAQNEDTATGTVVHSDGRLAVLMKRPSSGGGIYSGRGYRVQIYSGNDRAKATKIKIDFGRRFPGIKTYMTYIQPQFRIKVGDFRSRGEAEKMYQQVSTLYSPCMIVPDYIVVNTLKDKKKDDQ